LANKRKSQFSDTNAQILADLIVDPQTTEHLRVKIIKEILQSREGQNFFKTMFEEALSLGKCPYCDHNNHWAIPEDDLNEMGWVTHHMDSEVLEHTNDETCERWEEACKKKKIFI
jgi:hypothetical protein